MKQEFKKTKIKIEDVLFKMIDYFINDYKRYDYRFYEISEDLIVPVVIEGNKATIIHENRFISRIIYASLSMGSYFEQYYSGISMLNLTESNARTIYRSLIYRYEMRHKTPIKIVAFKSDPEVAFYRLDFDPSDTQKECPQWDLLLSNFTNVPAVKMFIGSLFIPDSDRSQYLWLYGKGGNGKSSLAKVLSRALGKFVRYEQVPKDEDKYWTYGLLGKRLIVIDDCNKYGFVQTGLFKSATGSSMVRVERKYGDPTDADLFCKFLFTSNTKPSVSNDVADQRRIIFSSAKNREAFEFDREFLVKLNSQLSNFLSNCVLEYMKNCSDGRPIPTDNTEALELAEEFEEDMAAWIESHYEYDQGSKVTLASFLDNLSRSPVRHLNKKRIYEYLNDQNVSKSKSNRVRVLRGLRQKIYQINWPNE